MSDARCRICERALETVFVDLGMSPLCESFVDASRLKQVIQEHHPRP